MPHEATPETRDRQHRGPPAYRTFTRLRHRARRRPPRRDQPLSARHRRGREPGHPRRRAAGGPGREWDYVLTNPPFGRKQSFSVFTDDGDIETERDDYQRPDFQVTTSNKQLNFVQHIMTILAESGTAAVVLPDNVLFEAGGGEKHPPPPARRFRFPHAAAPADRHLLQARRQGERAVLRQAAGREKPWTKDVWIYDFRTNQSFTLKERPLKRAHLDEFVAASRLADRLRRVETERFRRFGYDDSSSATSSTSTSSGSRIRASTIPTACRRRTRSPPRSWKSSMPLSNASEASPPGSRLSLPGEGFEPPTFGLQNRCTTTVLTRRRLERPDHLAQTRPLPSSLAPTE